MDLKTSQFLEPLFEYSGACAGCGETPYIKLLTQLFGDRALIANATGCSSIYGGNLPTTPYTTNRDGRGPGLGQLALRGQRRVRPRLPPRPRLAPRAGARSSCGFSAGRSAERLVFDLLEAGQDDEAGIAAQRERVLALRAQLSPMKGAEARRLETLADYLVRKSVWLVGGDGWAYDIGFGGLDHVLASNRDVNVLVLDTEVYSNTGGQQSKATPLGASAKFAEAGKESPKKDLGLLAMSYGHVYVARIAFGAKMSQTVQALQEAEAYPGPSLVIAYSHCIAHGYDMAFGVEQQKLAASSGVWPLYRYDPRRVAPGRASAPPRLGSAQDPARASTCATRAASAWSRRRTPQRFQRLLTAAETLTRQRYAVYQQLAGITDPALRDVQTKPARPRRAGRGGLR